ncbi:cation-translocating P-type ATPase [Candidatus Poribacteria bacterium]|nr:cation-translocating P-type ATPase [Candidatus Poribacteria bacterium]MBT7806330.1 cation-translocating P-type ATPase [Candidatus Poribacteria bacterium]
MGVDTTVRVARRQYAVGGMDCPGCAASIRNAVNGLAGVVDADVDFLAGEMSVSVDDGDPDIVGTVRRLGFTVSTHEDGGDGAQGDDALPGRWAEAAVLAASAALWIAGLVSGYVGRDAASQVLLVAALAVGGIPLLRSAASDLARRSITIDVLMSIAVGGAIALGEWAEAATVVVLFAVSELVERRTVAESRRAINDLLALIPATVTLLRDGRPVDVPVAEARVGDTAMARPGERFALDGAVVNGMSEVNEGPITGESKLLVKEPGDSVFAGSLNGSGSLDYTIGAEADGTVVARILAHVRDAQRSRAPTQRIVDKFAAYYTPAMLALAALTAVVPALLLGQPARPWVYRGLVLLVAGCPCAFVLATPVATASAMARLARMGVLVKGGAQLEALGAVRAVAFDKTGTLTAGTPRVTDVVACVGTPDELLALAASVEQRSEHVVARAIVDEAEGRGLDVGSGTGVFAAYPGRGATLTRPDGAVAVGSTRLLDTLGVSYDAHADAILTAQATGKTIALVALNDELLGYISLGDTVRPEARDAVARLARVGVSHTVMLTGDNRASGERVADAVGVRDARAGLLPDDKVRLVRELVARHGAAAMVGDGINDAPALAAATVGIAMGASGTDVAIETADVALMGDDLLKLPTAMRLARRARRTVVSNIAAAAGIKLGVMALVAVGAATLWMAVVADVGLTLVVVGNSLRLLRSPRAATGSAR